MIENHPLKEYSERAGVSLVTLAQSCRSTSATLSRIENRVQVPSLALVERIIAATGGALRADDFLSGSLSPDPTSEAAE